MSSSWDPTFHPLQLPETTNKPHCAPTLVQMCCDKIVSDSSLSLEGGISLPKTLIPHLLATALLKEKYLAGQALLPFWQEDTLILDEVLPQFLSNPKLLGDCQQQKIAMEKALLASTTLVTKWLSLIADEMEENSANAFHKEKLKIKKLDVSGFNLDEDMFLKLLKQHLRPKSSVQEKWMSRHIKKQTKTPYQNNTYYTIKLEPIKLELEPIQIKNVFLKIETGRVSTTVFSTRSPQNDKSSHLVGLDLSMSSLFNIGLVNLLPEITKCVNLTCLDISKNKLCLNSDAHAVSSLHDTILNLPKLRRLNLSNNRLSGCLSSLLGTSLPLEYLNLNACCLRPTDFLHLPVTLIHLDLSENNLHPFPLHLKNMKQLSILELEYCSFSLEEEVEDVCKFLMSLPQLSLINLASTLFENQAVIYQFLTSKNINQLIISRTFLGPNGESSALNSIANLYGKTLMWKGNPIIYIPSDSDDEDD